MFSFSSVKKNADLIAHTYLLMIVIYFVLLKFVDWDTDDQHNFAFNKIILATCHFQQCFMREMMRFAEMSWFNCDITWFIIIVKSHKICKKTHLL